MTRDYGLIYQQLSHLIGTMPDLSKSPSEAATQAWLGKAYALVKATGELVDAESLKRQSQLLGALVVGPEAARELQMILYRALASMELLAPPAVTGAFIPVGAAFDAFSAVAKILQGATSDVFIVDPYLDLTILRDFATAAPPRVSLRLLADEKDVKPTLTPAVATWIGQYGAERPLEARLAPARVLHDRAILIDGKNAWTITQSFNKLAARAPAEILKNDDIAARKIQAYEDLWSTGIPLP